MPIKLFALILSILGLIASLLFVGIVPSLVAFGLCIYLIMGERSISVVRPLAISFAGIVLPIVMYLNTYGFSFPKGTEGLGFISHIIVTNYSNLGIDMSFIEPAPAKEPALAEGTGGAVAVESPENAADAEDEIVYFSSEQEKADKEAARQEFDEDSIFESPDSIDPDQKLKGGVVSIAPSDDDMPSYGGMPLGTLIVAHYFREDDHNCNPVLVLKNETGAACRYECAFTARDADGNEIATSDKTVEVVSAGSLFVFEGRFDKRELGGENPDSYEFFISKRDPYEKDMADQVSVYTRVNGNSAILTAENKSDTRVKVDAYVLFFDGQELVDCMWMIPQNVDEVCLEPGSMASIRGDAYYRFDRVETYYTAYEAVVY